MAHDSAGTRRPETLETHPDRYRHIKLDVEGAQARITLDVDPGAALDPSCELKLNSYDLGVDIELADAVQRLRFEHPEIRAVVIQSGHEKVFCAGANIPSLVRASHNFKVNFCKFTNETRLAIEDASRHSGQRYMAALSGATAGGGYELALACDHILLVDDGSSAISLPEVPLLGVLPGTGGLTRLVDKRGVRRDHADVLCTTSEGIRGERALQWKLCDSLATRTGFDNEVETCSRKLAETCAAQGFETPGPGIHLTALEPEVGAGGFRYRFVEVALLTEERRAEITVHGPGENEPLDPKTMLAAGAEQWNLRAFRELDDALLRLRFHHPDLGLWVLRTQGDGQRVLTLDEALARHGDFWLAREMTLLRARTLRRLDLSARSLFALIEPGSCFSGSLLELALAADRSFMFDEEEVDVHLHLGPMNAGALPMSQGPSRLETRFCGDAEQVGAALEHDGPIDAGIAEQLGLVTFALDDIDWEDDVRVALEERVSMSPDALSGMEASLRFSGPESPESKIFARLSAWQNWVFIRPNATGEKGALTCYGKPERPDFDFERC